MVEKRSESEISWKVEIKTIIERGYDLDIKNPTRKEEEKVYSTKELMDLLKKSMNKSESLLQELQKEFK